MEISLRVNGVQRSVQSDEDVPLLWILREELGLLGTKFGCGMGLCGACTVHLNGAAVRACSTPISAASGQAVTTIEGLSQGSRPHPLQAAWVEQSVPQCGYCQPGQIMSAAALLAANPKPSDAEIEAAMAGNLCRCGTYPKIRAAIASASGRP